MRRGLILGKFMPPHTGHQHLIDFARSYADRVTVLVCSLADDPIPGALRHRWVQELHPDCRVVHVTDVVPQAPEEDPAFWPIWRELIHRHEPRGVDLVFTSEAYGWRLASELGAAHVPVDPARRVNPISAEAIRADPFGNWRFLPPPVRPYYVKRVCLFGPESSGKSTIARLLAERLDTVHAPEFARDYLDPRGGACGIEDMATIARGQAAAAASAARHATKLLVLDTDPWLTTVWSGALFARGPDEVRAAAERQQADLYILLTPDAPWVDDDQRYFPDVGDRGRFFDECRALLDDIGAAYVTIDGPHEARLAKATSAVRDAFPGL